jgi:hypothetical protein
LALQGQFDDQERAEFEQSGEIYLLAAGTMPRHTVLDMEIRSDNNDFVRKHLNQQGDRSLASRVQSIMTFDRSDGANSIAIHKSLRMER